MDTSYCRWQVIWKQVRDNELVLVDLRSEKEFALGSVPHSINIPLLNNDERHIVGKTYKEVGRIEATQLGMELFAEKASDFIDRLWSHATADTKRLAVYCWRGGMRSGMVGKWLAYSGLDVSVLQGGYKMFRRDVIQINDDVSRRDLIVLMGRTGSGKTDMIRSMPRSLPVIDLEGIARHRGSAFGAFAQTEPSPSQQNFENQLAERILECGDAPRFLFEIENFIGPCAVPQLLREKLTASKMVLVERDFDDRVKRLTAEYVPIWTKDVCGEFVSRMELLQTHISGEDYKTIIDAALNGNIEVIVSMLMRLRYDKSYDKAITKRKNQFIATFDLTADEDTARHYLINWLNERDRSPN